MSRHLLSYLQQSFFRSRRKTKQRKPSGSYRRTLSMEWLESRQMLSITPLQNLSVSENTGEKPQSKVFEYAGQWWTVMPHSSGTSVFRLDGTNWTPTQRITTAGGFHADVKVVGDLAHVLLFDKSSSQIATLQYDAADNRFEPWALQPQLVGVPISGSAETATIDVDSTGRMWVAYDVKTTVEVRYSDGVYTSWSSPITVASGMNSDDISTIVAMPNNTVGVLWSDQRTDLFYFRVHQDGAAPTAWSANEVAASQWAASVGGAMSDDHVNVAVASDGTLYAAVKTSYDNSSRPEIALLVRRPNGAWDNLYQVDTKGTRPIVVVNEAAGKLIVAYTQSDGGGNIYYRESPLDRISFGARQVLISGSNNNVTSTKSTSTHEIVFLAGSSSTARGVLFSFDTATLVTNQAPVVNAGPNLSVVLGSSAALDGTVSDNSLPSGPLNTTWTKVSGPGTATFANASAVDTSATFSEAGSYVLRLTASDGQLSAADEMTVSVTSPAPTNEAPAVDAGPDRSIVLGDTASLDGTVTDDELPSPGSLSTLWTRISGPGAVTFANASAVDTTASFSDAGTYILRLTANDGQLTRVDEMTVTVSSPAENAPPPGDPSASGSDSVEIAFQDGLFPYVNYIGTSDAKISVQNPTANYGTADTIDINGSADAAGLIKWDISAIPTGSVITSAVIELNVTDASSQAYQLYAVHRAWNEFSGTWQQYAEAKNWSGAGAQGPVDHGTAVLGELTATSTGTTGIMLNAAGIKAVQAWINDPIGNRGIILQNYAASDGLEFSTSEASNASLRPKLIISYEPPSPTNEAPAVDAGPDRTVPRGQPIVLSGAVNYNVQLDGLEVLTVLWSKASGPGTVTFGDPTSAHTTAEFSAAGDYMLRLTASDGALSAFDELMVTVT